MLHVGNLKFIRNLHFQCYKPWIRCITRPLYILYNTLFNDLNQFGYNLISFNRFSGNSISIQIEELFKSLASNNVSNLGNLSLEAIENSKSLRELSMILFSARVDLDFDLINRRIIQLLPTDTFPNVMVLMRVLLETGYYTKIKIFNELTSKYRVNDIDNIIDMSDCDISNYIFIYSKLVEKGLIKSSIDDLDLLYEQLNARIVSLNPFNFADILKSLSILKSSNMVINTERIVNYINDNIKLFTPEEISSIWYSLTSYDINDLYIKFAEQLLSNGDFYLKMDVEALIRLIIAIGKSRVNDVKVVKVIDNLIPQIRRLIETEEIDLYGASKVIVALNNCNYKCDSLLNRISKYFRTKYQEVPNDDKYTATIVNLSIGFGRSLLSDKRVFNIISQLLLEGELLEYLSTQELINVVQAFAKVRLLDTKLLAHIHKILESRIDNLSLELCIKYIHSVAILEFKNYGLQKKVIDIIEEYHKNNMMNEFQIAKVCYSAGKLEIPCSFGLDELNPKENGLWISGYSGRKTSHITAGRKPIHVRRLKKVW